MKTERKKNTEIELYKINILHDKNSQQIKNGKEFLKQIMDSSEKPICNITLNSERCIAFPEIKDKTRIPTPIQH